MDLKHSNIEGAIENKASEESEMVNYVTQKWSRTIVQPLLIALVVSSFFTTLLFIIPVLTTLPYNLVWIAPFIFITCLEGVYTTIWLSNPKRRHLNKLAYRAAEFLALALFLRVFVWLLSGSYPVFTDIPVLLRNPQFLVDDGLFIISLITLLLAWLRAIMSAKDFEVMAIDYAEAYYFTLPTSEQEISLKPSFSNRGALLGQIFQLWIMGGVILAVVTAVVSLDPMQKAAEKGIIGVQTLKLPPIFIAALVIYFLAGLLLISQARLGALNARWLHQGAVKRPEVEKVWNRHAIRIMLLVAFLALFLPLGSTYVLGSVLEWIVVGVLNLAAMVGFLLTLLLSGIFSMFTPPPSEAELLTATPAEIDATPLPPPRPPPVTPPDETFQILVSSAFWAVAIVVTAIALSFFLRDRGISLRFELVKKFGLAVVTWLRSLWLDLSETAAEIGHDVRSRLSRRTEEGVDTDKPPWRFIRLNALSPRDQVRYFYLSTVRRAQEQGVPRRDGETPLEFANDMKETWPEAETEIDELTGAFLRARYSQDNIEKAELNPVKKQWRRVKGSLRQRRKKANETTED